MKSNERTWSVGEMAARLGLQTHVLRYWEDQGLVTPGRDSAGRRRYHDREAIRLAVVVRSKLAGMSLEQIASLLDAEAPGRHRVLEEHLADLDRREAEMRRSRAMTEHALRCEAHDIANCPRFQEYVADLVGPGAAPGSVLDDELSEPAGRTTS